VSLGIINEKTNRRTPYFMSNMCNHHQNENDYDFMKFHVLKAMINEIIKAYKKATRFSLSYISLKTGQPSYLLSLLLFPSHHCTRSSFLITLIHPSLITSRFKIANRSYHHSAPILWNSLPTDLRHVAHHVNPSPVLNSPSSDLSTSLFLKS